MPLEMFGLLFDEEKEFEGQEISLHCGQCCEYKILNETHQINWAQAGHLFVL